MIRRSTVLLGLLLLGAMMPVPSASAAPTLYTYWFVGEGSDDVVTQTSGDGVFQMSLDGHGDATTTFITVVGNDLDHNPYLPTFEFGAPITLTGGTMTFYHYAAQAAAAAGCGLVGHLYNGEELIAETELVPAVSGLNYDEFIFVFDDISGTYADMSFQPVQSSGPCGWSTIEHIWGSDDYPGRLEVEIDESGGDLLDIVRGLINHTLEGELLVEHSFLNATNATSDVYNYNWTTDKLAWELGYEVETLNGSVMINVTDPDGLDVFGASINGTESGVSGIEAFIEGQYRITITFDQFVGNVSLYEVLPEPEPVDDTPLEEEAVEDPLLAIQRAFPLQQESKSLPSPAIGLLLAGLAVAGIVTRRRD